MGLIRFCGRFDHARESSGVRTPPGQWHWPRGNVADGLWKHEVSYRTGLCEATMSVSGSHGGSVGEPRIRIGGHKGRDPYSTKARYPRQFRLITAALSSRADRLCWRETRPHPLVAGAISSVYSRRIRCDYGPPRMKHGREAITQSPTSVSISAVIAPMRSTPHRSVASVPGGWRASRRAEARSPRETIGQRYSLRTRNPGHQILWFNEGGRHGAQGPQSAGPSGEDRSLVGSERPG